MSAMEDHVPSWNPATYNVSFIATCTRYGKNHVPAGKQAIIQACDIQHAFAAMKCEPPTHISTAMKEVGFPAITLQHIEIRANSDGIVGRGTDATDLSAVKTLRQLQRCAITVLTTSDPGRLGKVLLATEMQQKALAASWPEYRKINHEKGWWVSTIRVKERAGVL
ncbi:hypothetical protein F5Y16DRAFT_406339 [Xylariaceae sp. FL0255]|nr:hypothetical protein F5Y16DRAFT_406339 [Xylariaceae sp. FL0255]